MQVEARCAGYAQCFEDWRVLVIVDRDEGTTALKGKMDDIGTVPDC